MIKLIEVFETDNISTNLDRGLTRKFSTRDIFVNPEHVVCIRAEAQLARKLREGRCSGIPEGIDNFTRIYMDRGQTGIDVIVTGSPDEVKSRLSRGVLKG